MTFLSHIAHFYNATEIWSHREYICHATAVEKAGCFSSSAGQDCSDMKDAQLNHLNTSPL